MGRTLKTVIVWREGVSYLASPLDDHPSTVRSPDRVRGRGTNRTKGQFSRPGSGPSDWLESEVPLSV